MIEIPIWKKVALKPEEAAAYSNIGVNKIRKLANEEGCPFLLMSGSHILIKRKEFEEYISKRDWI